MWDLEPRRLYLLYGRELRRFLTGRVRCDDTAADLTQEAFLRLLSRQPGGRIENPRAFLYRIAANLVTDHFRRAPAGLTPADAALETIPDTAPDQERAALARDQVRRLEDAIAALPPRQREVLLLHKFEGMSYDEIASRLGISRNTVMVHMMRALALCRARLGDDV